MGMRPAQDGWGVTSSSVAPPAPPPRTGQGRRGPFSSHQAPPHIPIRDKVKLKGISHERKTSRGQCTWGGSGREPNPLPDPLPESGGCGRWFPIQGPNTGWVVDGDGQGAGGADAMTETKLGRY